MKGEGATLTNIRPMFDLRINQVVGFYYRNVWKTPLKEWHFKWRCRSLTCIFIYNVIFPQVFFKHFASNNKLPGFYISGTMVGNGLVVKTSEWRQLKMAKVRINLSLTFLCNIYMMKVNTIIETLEQGAKYAPSSL